MINYATKSHWIISGFSCTDAHSGSYSEGVKEFYWKVVFNLKTPISLGVVVFRADYAVVYVSKIIFRHFHAKIDPVFGWSRLMSGWSSLDLCSFAPNICSMREDKWQLYYKTVSYMKDFWVRYHHLTLPEMLNAQLRRIASDPAPTSPGKKVTLKAARARVLLLVFPPSGFLM